MATIELYKDKINSMSNYIQQAKNAVNDFGVDLSVLKSKILGINSSVCDNVVSSISSSSQTQEEQIAGLETTQKEVNVFIDLTINRDNSAADAVSKAKDDFYKKYSYLKPECEKSGWEKFCDGLKKVGDWCKDHWKEIFLKLNLQLLLLAYLYLDYKEAECIVHKNGEIEITDWEGYPEGGSKPDGKLKLLEREDYTKARKAANNENASIHRHNPELKGKQIHEIQPVKFSGSPTNHSNKIALTQPEHAKYTRFWKQIQELAELISN